jgi:hypothetical protein
MRPGTLKARNQKSNPMMDDNYDDGGLLQCVYKFNEASTTSLTIWRPHGLSFSPRLV